MKSFATRFAAAVGGKVFYTPQNVEDTIKNAGKVLNNTLRDKKHDPNEDTINEWANRGFDSTPNTETQVRSSEQLSPSSQYQIKK